MTNITELQENGLDLVVAKMFEIGVVELMRNEILIKGYGDIGDVSEFIMDKNIMRIVTTVGVIEVIIYQSVLFIKCEAILGTSDIRVGL